MPLKRALLQEDASIVNVLQYGSALTHNTIQAAVTGIGSTRATLLLTPGSWSITGNLSIPANILLWIPTGATVTIGSGVTMSVYEYVAEVPDWRSGGGTFTHLRYADMAGRIGWKQAGTGAIDRTVTSKLQDTFDARDFGMSPSVSNNAAAFQAAVTAAAAAGKGLRIPGGTYTFGSTLNITTSHLHIFGEGKVVLQPTFTGVAVFVDGGAAGSGIHGVRLDNLMVNGNANTTLAWQFRAAHNLVAHNLRAANCDVGFTLVTCHNAYFAATTCSSAEGEFTIKNPSAGIHLTRRTAGEICRACVFDSPRCEGMSAGSGWGMYLQYANHTHINGGSFRLNRVGVQIDPGGQRFNTLTNCYFEGNSVVDYDVWSDLNAARNCIFQSVASLAAVQIRASTYVNSFHNCYIRVINLAAGSNYTSLYDCFILTGGLTGTGTSRLRNCHNSNDVLSWQNTITDA